MTSLHHENYSKFIEKLTGITPSMFKNTSIWEEVFHYFPPTSKKKKSSSTTTCSRSSSKKKKEESRNNLQIWFSSPPPHPERNFKSHDLLFMMSNKMMNTKRVRVDIFPPTLPMPAATISKR